jgi:hypothetical protein
MYTLWKTQNLMRHVGGEEREKKKMHTGVAVQSVLPLRQNGQLMAVS